MKFNLVKKPTIAVLITIVFVCLYIDINLLAITIAYITALTLFFAFYFLHKENSKNQNQLEELLSIVNLRNVDLRENKEELLQNVEELQRMQDSLVKGRHEKERFRI